MDRTPIGGQWQARRSARYQAAPPKKIDGPIELSSLGIRGPHVAGVRFGVEYSSAAEAAGHGDLDHFDGRRVSRLGKA